MNCKHVYKHLDTIKRRESCGYNDLWVRIDYYFCEKCLDQQEIKKSKTSRDKPDWY